jgi:hypothetical protein
MRSYISKATKGSSIDLGITQMRPNNCPVRTMFGVSVSLEILTHGKLEILVEISQEKFLRRKFWEKGGNFS